ncbi:MAG: cytochrome c [Hyphomonadaceae bacterium]
MRAGASRRSLLAALVIACALTVGACVVAASESVANDVAVVEPAPIEADPAALGERLYQERCATCHDAGRAPPRAQIAANSPQEILEALDTGFMASVAMFMSEREKTILANHLSQPPTR